MSRQARVLSVGRVFWIVLALAAIPAARSDSQRPPAVTPATATTRSVPLTDISYTVAFDTASARERTLRVTMRFAAGAGGGVVLSLPAWTPGAYEISNFSRWVMNFRASAGDRALDWDKLDQDTWRIRDGAGKRVTVSFDYLADSLDNAMAWTRPDFALFNGTNVFLYPEGRGFDFPSTVSIETSPTWLVATGMTATSTARTFSATNYHDLVDMPFFVGRFDLDSVRIADSWVRLATYPMGSVAGAQRAQAWDWLRRIIPPQVAVMNEVPWRTYTVLQIADSSYGGASGLEHQNSHVDVITPFAIGNPFLASLYAHEIFHAWNVKRLRPADLWPYRYDSEQPTPWLWMSEGITDYYADLAMVRGGVVDSAGFLETSAEKIAEVEGGRPVALEDASLSTWVHPVDGTGYVYYSKGSLAGLLLDIMIRDASDNRASLDDVMARLYRETYKRGRGFTGDQWWRAVSEAAGGRSFADFARRYIDGRERFPYDAVLPLAGLRLVMEPRLGVNSLPDSSGAVIVTGVQPSSSAAEAGVRPGDVLLSVGDIEVRDQTFGAQYRRRYAGQGGASVPIRLRRGVETLTLTHSIRLGPSRLEVDPAASEKAVRIRQGIMRGK